MSAIYCDLIFNLNSTRKERVTELKRVLNAFDDCSLTFLGVEFRDPLYHQGKTISAKMVVTVCLTEIEPGAEPVNEDEAEKKVNAELAKCRFEFDCRLLVDPVHTCFRNGKEAR